MPALVLGAVSVGASIYGQLRAGSAAKKAGEFNAQALEQQAEDAVARGQEAASRLRGQVRGLIGAQRVAFAGQNVRLGQADASATDVAVDTAYQGELDVQQVTANAAREAWGYRTDAQSARMGGAAAQSAARWSALGTAAGGASQLLTAYGWQRSMRR